VLAIHGLGATKGSFLPTVVALSEWFRVIALDLPGFGDFHKPIGAPYDPRFFASACADLLDRLELDRVHVIGNSLGGRIALELALSRPRRVDRLALLASYLAWRRGRAWAPLVRLTRPELGLVQVAPRALVDGIVRRMIPGADCRGCRFLRSYVSPAGEQRSTRRRATSTSRSRTGRPASGLVWPHSSPTRYSSGPGEIGSC
jgi:pimeloyl-ACP methyl ester carboxylesterase